MSEQKRGRGRPAKYPKIEGKSYDGAPKLNIRFDPELFEWIQARGGGSWVRQIVATAREKGKLSVKDLAPLADLEAEGP